MVTTDGHELSLCVEIAIATGSWVERLPPAPGTSTVTVSFDDVELAARDRTAVAELGYTVVGTGVVRHVHDVAHLVVQLSTIDRHPRWWRALLDLADRVYDLRFGPVQHVLDDVLRAHAEGPADGRAATRPRLHAPTRPHPNA